MKHIVRPLIFFSILVVLFLATAGCTQTSIQPTTPAPVTVVSPAGTPAPAASATKEEMVAFVKEAVAYAKANGKDNALAEISNPKGSFVRGELYLYAYDYTGTTIAHPVNPEKIGVNRFDEKDAHGKYYIRELMDATTNGTGFVEYTYINPLHDKRVERKLGYVMKVDDDWWLGSGIYQGPVETPAGSAVPGT